MSGQSYSEEAWDAALEANGRPDAKRQLTTVARLTAGLDAAHDRKELGLDASVCARTLLNEIAAWLVERGPEWDFTVPACNEIAKALLAEFGGDS